MCLECRPLRARRLRSIRLVMRSIAWSRASKTFVGSSLDERFHDIAHADDAWTPSLDHAVQDLPMPRGMGCALWACPTRSHAPPRTQAHGIAHLMDDLYREEILQHYKRPHHWGPMEDPDLEAEDYNPLCGDELKVMLKV